MKKRSTSNTLVCVVVYCNIVPQDEELPEGRNQASDFIKMGEGTRTSVGYSTDCMLKHSCSSGLEIQS